LSQCSISSLSMALTHIPTAAVKSESSSLRFNTALNHSKLCWLLESSKLKLTIALQV
jgi:hypothetical protein